jgi:hypothetical protein
MAVALFLTMAGSGLTWADPPAHAPAHGYRAKHHRNKYHMHDHHERHERAVHSGVQIIFDSERGVHIAVGLPGLFFHEGSFYRHTSGGWQMSMRADGSWEPAKAVPSNVMNAWQPGPTKRAHRD